MERVQKILSNAGYCSRRAAEQLIAEGRVTVNGKQIHLGDQATPADTIRVDNKLIVREKPVYLIFNKPTGCVTALTDAKYRTIMHYIRCKERVFPVGRLDFDTSGLLLLTNDGDFANKIMHPRYEINKTYVAELDRPIGPRHIAQLEQGIKLEDGMTSPAIVSRSRPEKIEITIHEGKNRIVRRMLEALGYTVVRLERTHIGSLSLGNLKPGKYKRSNEPPQIGELKESSFAKHNRKTESFRSAVEQFKKPTANFSQNTTVRENVNRYGLRQDRPRRSYTKKSDIDPSFVVPPGFAIAASRRTNRPSDSASRKSSFSSSRSFSRPQDSRDSPRDPKTKNYVDRTPRSAPRSSRPSERRYSSRDDAHDDSYKDSRSRDFSRNSSYNSSYDAQDSRSRNSSYPSRNDSRSTYSRSENHSRDSSRFDSRSRDSSRSSRDYRKDSSKTSSYGSSRSFSRDDSSRNDSSSRSHTKPRTKNRRDTRR